MYCPSCGKEITEDSRFCRHCGAPQVVSEPAPTEETVEPAMQSSADAIEPEDASNGRWVAWAGGSFMLLILFVLIMAQSKQSSETLSDNLTAMEADNLMAADAIDNSLDAAADAPAVAAIANWSYSEDVDKVRGATSYFATTTSTNTIHQNPPYDSDTSMSLTVRRAPAFGTDVMLTISSGQMMCPSYEGCSGTVSFDGGPPESISFNGPADNSSDTIFVEGAQSFIAKLKRSKKLVIEKTLYEAGNPQFEFDVHGLKWEH